MSSAPDYTKLKVTDLKDLLQKRSLPTQGLKAELIARLTAADAESNSSTPTASTPSAAPATLATDETTTTTATTTSTTPQPAASPENKLKRKTIASLFESDSPAPSNASAAAPTETPITTTATTEPTATEPTATEPTTIEPTTTESEKPTAPALTLDEEIARRKKRAERFGLNPEESETLKKLERARRFGSGEMSVEEVLGKAGNKMDQPLPERKRQRRQGQGNAYRGGAQNYGRRNTGGNVGRQGQGKGQGQGQRKVGMSEEDRKKAEERKKRFGLA